MDGGNDCARVGSIWKWVNNELGGNIRSLKDVYIADIIYSNWDIMKLDNAGRQLMASV